MVLLHVIGRLLTFLLLVALAVAGLLVAIFVIDTGTTDLSLPHLARILDLPDLRDRVGDYLDQLERSGPTAKLSALAGLLAIAAGVLLLLGAITPRRERLVVLAEGDDGRLAARKRPLTQVAEAETRSIRGLTDSKVRLRPSRSGHGGRIDVVGSRARTAAGKDVEKRVAQALQPLAEPFGMAPRVRTRTGDRGARVE